MKIKLKLFLTMLVFLLSVPCIAQGVYHEVGFGIGPLSFRGDWGERQDSKTNIENTGFGLSLLHFAHSAFENNSQNYFNSHFKIRNQITIHHTNLNHYGRWVDNEGPPFLLANMTGKTTVIELGTGLEWNFKKIRIYERQINVVQPYASFGINYVYFNPSVETSLPGEIGAPSNTWPTFLPSSSSNQNPISNSSATTFSANFQAGMRYRMSQDFDLFLEGRWHYYFSDLVDGLNPRNPNNGNNDWMFLLNVGFAYYLN